MSYAHGTAQPYEEEEEDGFASYKDFNNRAGPPRGAFTSSQSYDMLLADTAPPPLLSKTDWNEGEGRREAQASKPRQKLNRAVGGLAHRRWAASREWLRAGSGNRGKLLLFAVFGFIVAVALTLYFVIPRSPGIAYGTLTSDDSNPQTNSAEATFSWDANLTVIVDSRSSYIPVRMSSLSVEVTLLSTGVVIGTGSTSKTVPGRDLTNVRIPITFSGQFSNSSDATYASMLGSCGPIYPTTDRGTLDLSFAFTIKIPGLIGESHGSAQESGLVCPVAFSSSHS